MRALVVTAPRQAAVLDVPDPVPAAPESCSSRSSGSASAAPTSSSTRARWRTSSRGTRTSRCASGTSGPAASARCDGAPPTSGWLGKRVTGDTMLGCGHCEYCSRRSPARLPRPLRGRHPRRLGGCARREGRSFPTRFAYEIPEHVSLAAAALVEPGGNSLRAVRAANIEPGHRVLVLGSGTIGLLAAQFALAAGAEVHVGRQCARAPSRSHDPSACRTRGSSTNSSR